MSASVYRNTERKARKARGCRSCPAGIAAGDHYIEHFSVTDGDAFSASFCAPCAALIDAIWDERDHDDHLDYDELWEAAQALEDDPETRLLSLAWHARMGTPARYLDDVRCSIYFQTPDDVERVRVAHIGQGQRCEVDVTAPERTTPAEYCAWFLAIPDDELRSWLAEAA